MSKHKFFMAASAITLAAVTVAAPVSANYSSHTFTDVSDRYDEAVTFFYDMEIIKGLSPTQFGTQQPLTRGDAAVILANTLFLDTENAPDAGFKDLNTRVKGAVNALADYGVVSGVTATEFKPNEPLSRGAMAKFLVTAFMLEDYAVETPFTDVGGVFETYIEALYGAGVTNGKTETSYGTTADITRGEFANLLYETIWLGGYYAVISDVAITSPTAISISLTEAVPEDFTARDAADFFYYSVELEDGSVTDFEPTAYTLSADRLTLTIEHANYSLAGRAGVLIVEDFESIFELPFDFK
ncbi:S-layer homology domain-containing protein [Indiicoccus explosivorum]|uniref:S-layer homology domain-containing protein n=1 Tax=Indiicoccus explosivorum TaxID=1917864 RepID=UPI000B43BA8C|nr:S-layer homology domain-containing protein [Indiicoccus explosivorum]